MLAKSAHHWRRASENSAVEGPYVPAVWLLCLSLTWLLSVSPIMLCQPSCVSTFGRLISLCVQRIGASPANLTPVNQHLPQADSQDSPRDPRDPRAPRRRHGCFPHLPAQNLSRSSSLSMMIIDDHRWLLVPPGPCVEIVQRHTVLLQ